MFVCLGFVVPIILASLFCATNKTFSFNTEGQNEIKFWLGYLKQILIHQVIEKLPPKNFSNKYNHIQIIVSVSIWDEI